MHFRLVQPRLGGLQGRYNQSLFHGVLSRSLQGIAERPRAPLWQLFSSGLPHLLPERISNWRYALHSRQELRRRSWRLSLAEGSARLHIRRFHIPYFKCALLPKFVLLTTAIAQAKFMSLLATFITSINGSARAPSGEALSIRVLKKLSIVAQSLEIVGQEAPMASDFFVDLLHLWAGLFVRQNRKKRHQWTPPARSGISATGKCTLSNGKSRLHCRSVQMIDEASRAPQLRAAQIVSSEPSNLGERCGTVSSKIVY